MILLVLFNKEDLLLFIIKGRIYLQIKIDGKISDVQK
jgi:hypothetical protein